MKTFTVTGTYGPQKSETFVFCATDPNGGTWYAAEGAQTVNRTFDEIRDGVDIEELSDIDCFTWSKGIESESELENAIQD